MSRLNQKIKTGNRIRGNDASEWRECFVSSGKFFCFGWKSFSARALSGGATTMNEKHANNSFFFCFVLGGIKCVCMCVVNNHKELQVVDKSSLIKSFNFDRVFGTNSKQVDVYKVVAAPLVS